MNYSLLVRILHFLYNVIKPRNGVFDGGYDVPCQHLGQIVKQTTEKVVAKPFFAGVYAEGKHI